MQRILCLCAVLLWFVSAPAGAAKPQRIVSLGLCTDQLLLMLVERERIASLSSFARESDMSYMADHVGDIPLNNASIEEVIGFEPDLVIASEFVAWDTVRFLRQLGYPVRQIPLATSVEQIYAVIAQFGNLTGSEQRARDTIAVMRRELADIRSRYANRPRKTAIIYSPNGFTVGADTLENDMLKQAGYRNLAAELGVEGFRSISLERLVAADPDLLHIDRNLSRQASLATAYLAHPAVQQLIRQKIDLDIPTRLRICAGPMITEAIELLAARR